LLALRGGLTQFVQLRVIALADHRALGNLQRRVWIDCVFKQMRKAGKGIKLSQRGADGRAGVICQQRLQRRHLLERTQQRQAVAGVECIIGHLGQDALHVVYVSQDIIQALGKNMVVIQRGYGV